MPTPMHDNEVAIDEALVRRLLRDQMPEFADLAIAIVEPWGTDNAIWRLGEAYVVRLPRIPAAVDQVEFEAVWLPRLRPHLDVTIPDPVAVGRPSSSYPFPWNVHRWVDGELASPQSISDSSAFAIDLARVVRQLRTIPTVGARPARNRARPLAEYDEETRRAISSSASLIDAETATAIWEEALAAPVRTDPPVWVHGDLEGNCLVDGGSLCGLVDWGLGCIGDPAIDVQVIWSPLFTPESRVVFIEELGLDDAVLTRARGAAINQACGALGYYLETYPLIVERSWHKLDALGVARR